MGTNLCAGVLATQFALNETGPFALPQDMRTTAADFLAPKKCRP